MACVFDRFPRAKTIVVPAQATIITLRSTVTLVWGRNPKKMKKILQKPFVFFFFEDLNFVTLIYKFWIGFS